MILNGYKAGQMGNRLFHISQLMVLAIEGNTTLVDFSFDNYMVNFENLWDKPFIIYPSSKASPIKYKFLTPLKQRLPNLRDFLNHRKLNSKWLSCIDQNGLVMTDYNAHLNERKQYSNYIVEGWINKDITPLAKYRQTLANFFVPKREHVKNVERLVAEAKQGADLLMGIHIRRGDYKEYKNGIFYFDDNVFINIMRNMQQRFADKKIHFLVCSNEDVHWENYKEFTVFKATNQIVEDMYALSYCDYIAGPISTYSMWASFIAQKPLYQIQTRDQEFDFNHFRVVVDRSI